MSWVPPSGEVLAEEIVQAFEDSGIPREEQGEFFGTYARALGDELAALSRALASREMP